jgi:hypothetical protein
MTTAIEWATTSPTREDKVMARLTAHRDKMNNLRLGADQMIEDLTGRPDLRWNKDASIAAMLHRLHKALVTEQESVVTLLAESHDNLTKEPGQSWHLANVGTKLFGKYDGGGPLGRMEQIYRTMDELRTLPFYEKDEE